MDRTDRRVKRTQSLLARALIDLTLEKGYDLVTIRELTERAGIGYATFFRHYPDKDGLLLAVADVVLAELQAVLQPQLGMVKHVEEGTAIFRYVQANADLCRVLFDTHRSHAIMRRLREGGVLSVLAHNTPLSDAVVPADVAANHLVSAILALIRWWLEMNMPYSPERMGMIYDELIVAPTYWLAFVEQQHGL